MGHSGAAHFAVFREDGPTFQDELGLLHVSKQLRYCGKLTRSQLAIRLEQLSMQLSKEMGHAVWTALHAEVKEDGPCSPGRHGPYARDDASQVVPKFIQSQVATLEQLSVQLARSWATPSEAALYAEVKREGPCSPGRHARSSRARKSEWTCEKAAWRGQAKVADSVGNLAWQSAEQPILGWSGRVGWSRWHHQVGGSACDV